MRSVYGVCKTCGKRCSEERYYCSRECAPCGHLNDGEGFANYPLDWDDAVAQRPDQLAPHSKCSHRVVDAYTCAGRILGVPRYKVELRDRCLCVCHHQGPEDEFTDYEES